MTFKQITASIISRLIPLRIIRIIFFLFIGLALEIPEGFAQYGPLYWQLRGYDSIPDYRKAMQAFSRKDFTQAQLLLDSIGNTFLARKNYRRYYQVENEKGVMLYLTKQYDSSFRVFTRNVDLMISHRDTLHYEFAIAMRIMGYLANAWEGVSQSKLYFLERQYQALRKMNDKSPVYVDCLGDLGLYYVNTPELLTGINYLLESKKMALALGLKHTVLVNDHTITNKLAVEQPYLALEIFENQYKTAGRKYYRDSTALIILAYTIAEKLHETGNFSKAVEYLHEADEIQRATNYPHIKFKAAIPVDLAVNYSKLGNAENFMKYSEIALSAYEQIKENRPFPQYYLYSVIGEGYLPFQSDSALFYLDKACNSLISQDVPEDDKLAEVLALKTEALMAGADFAGAEKTLVRALKLLVVSPFDSLPAFICSSAHQEELRRLYNLANNVYLQKYMLTHEKMALQMALQSASCYDTLTRMLARNISDADAIRDFAKEYKTVASRIFDNLDIADIPQQMAFRFVSTAKAFQLMTEIERYAYAQAVSTHDSLWRSKLELEKMVRFLKNQKTSALIMNDSLLADSLGLEIRNKLIEMLIVNYSIIRSQSSVSNFLDLDSDFSLPETKLNDRHLVLDVFHSDKKVILLGIDQDGTKLARIDEQEQFDTAVQDFLRDVRTGNQTDDSGGALANLLLKPMTQKISLAAKITFIPDNSLLQVPLEVLPSPVNGKKLIENQSIAYHYSFALWNKSSQKAAAENNHILALAPVFETDQPVDQVAYSRGEALDDAGFDFLFSADHLVPLPFTKREVRKLDSLFTSCRIDHRVLLNKDATKSNLKKYAGDYSIIHIASHGFASKKEPEFSGVFLAPEKIADTCGGISDNGFLHIGELSSLKTNASLVVLSSCNSGVGAIYESEGVMALPRAFIFAGVPNVMASLWRVNDAKTSVLMVAFYQYLLQGNDYANSLRLAKLDCIAKGYLPLNWAGFVLIGS